MEKAKTRRSEETFALLLQDANPASHSTLRLLLRSGLARQPTAKMVRRHIHPRHKRGKV